MESEGDIRAFCFRFSVRHAPAALEPIAQLHPADIRAARLAIFGQMLLRPAAAPVLEPDLVRRWSFTGEVHNHFVNLTWVFPEQAVAFGQRQCKRSNIHRLTE